ncbi:MAG: anti-sigma factor [Candidatus Limnocylindrales bacterium]
MSTATTGEMSCDEVLGLSGLYVLDALERDERAAVADHLATCDRSHGEVRELGGVVPALANLAEPIEAPAELKARVLDAVQRAAGNSVAATSKVQEFAVKPWAMDVPKPAVPSPAARRWAPPAWASWAAALAAVVILAVVGVWGLGAQSAADHANDRAQVLGEAIAAFSSEGSSTAVLRGSGQHAGSSGFAAFTPDGTGYLVMVGLDPAPAGQTYQAWYIDDGGPHSAGLMTVDADGYAVMVDDQPMMGATMVALTVEPVGGSALPTTDPFAAGEVQSPA